MMTLLYLLLEAFCDKVLGVGDIFVCRFFFPKILIEGVQYINKVVSRLITSINAWNIVVIHVVEYE